MVRRNNSLQSMSFTRSAWSIFEDRAAHHLSRESSWWDIHTERSFDRSQRRQADKEILDSRQEFRRAAKASEEANAKNWTMERVEYDKGVLENRRALREQNRIASAIARKDHYQRLSLYYKAKRELDAAKERDLIEDNVSTNRLWSERSKIFEQDQSTQSLVSKSQRLHSDATFRRLDRERQQQADEQALRELNQNAEDDKQFKQMLSDKRRIARENRAIEIKERAEHYRSIREYNKALHDAYHLDRNPAFVTNTTDPMEGKRWM